MQTLDYVVLVGYFATMIIIGVLCSMRIKKQDDFFMGGRGFGKLLQTFAAFGAGTGAQDPINVGRTTWTSGLSGIWSALTWLFITPFYWIFAVWYRRMRHTTLGDWFVERFESKPLGVAYTVFAFSFYIFYLSTMFSAISKVANPLLGSAAVNTMMGWLQPFKGFIDVEDPGNLKWIMVPIIALVVILYGVLGGLAAAYWTDLIQGLCIILLSVILIPYGLNGLVQKYGDTSTQSTMDGFEIMHERVTPQFFQLFGGPQAGEFPLHYIIAFTLLSLMGIVVQPHFIATGGGTAKSENAARIGLVTGNFLKRLCTIGWALTGLIVLALLADSVEIAKDPDEAWGVASREILGTLNLGLVGLMLACLLAALMSSADCYMLVTSALVVRNVYAAYINPEASEKTYIMAGRLASLLVIVGAAAVSLIFYDVFAQYKLALEVATVFAAPFWIGMFWRRATAWAAWLTIAFSLLAFIVVPMVLPYAMPALKTDQQFAIASDVVTTTINRRAEPTDTAKRESWRTALQQVVNDTAETPDSRLYGVLKKIGSPTPVLASGQKEHAEWMAKYNGLLGQLDANSSAKVEARVKAQVKADKLDAAAAAELAKKLQEEADAKLTEVRNQLKEIGLPPAVTDGAEVVETIKTGGQAIFWTGGLTGAKEMEVINTKEEGNEKVVTERLKGGDLTGQGSFNLDYVIYQMVGMNLRQTDKAMLETLRLPPRLITPFLVMILLSLVTPRGSQAALDRYYVKMKTPVNPDPEQDLRDLEESFNNPSRFDDKKLIPGSSLEFQKPSGADIGGFVISVAVCFVFLGLAWWVANIGMK